MSVESENEQKKKQAKKAAKQRAAKIAALVEEKKRKEKAKREAHMRPRETRMIFEYIYMNKSSRSQNLIATENNFNFTGGRLEYRKPLSLDKGHDFVFSGLYLKSIGTQADEFEVPDLLNVYLQYLYDPEWINVDFFGGLHYENQVFVNLERFNQGLAQGENTLYWSQGGIEKVFQVYGRKLILSGSVFSLLAGESSFDLGQAALGGSKYHIEAVYLWGDGIRFGAAVTKDSVSAGKYSLDQTTSLLSLKYSFL